MTEAEPQPTGRRAGDTEPVSISLYQQEADEARRLAHEEGKSLTGLFRGLLRDELKRRGRQVEK